MQNITLCFGYIICIIFPFQQLAVENYFNISSEALVDVPAGCCLTVSVKNVSDQAIDVQNANLIIERVA